MFKIKKYFVPRHKIYNEKYIVIKQIVDVVLFSTLLFIILYMLFSLLFLKTDIAGSLECSAYGNINDDTGQLKLHQLENVHCKGSFSGKIPLIVLFMMEEN